MVKIEKSWSRYLGEEFNTLQTLRKQFAKNTDVARVIRRESWFLTPSTSVLLMK